MMMIVYLFVLIFGHVAAFDSRPPIDHVPELCDDLLPRHDGAAAQNTTPPFTIVTDPSCVKPGIHVQVTITNTTAGHLDGMMIQARSGSNWGSGSLQGTFTVIQESTQTLSCPGGIDNVIGHKGHMGAASVVFIWTAPSALTEDIMIGGTFLQGFDVFWVNVTESLTYNEDCQSSVTLPTEAPTEAPTTASGPSLHPTGVSTLSIIIFVSHWIVHAVSIRLT